MCLHFWQSLCHAGMEPYHPPPKKELWYLIFQAPLKIEIFWGFFFEDVCKSWDLSRAESEFGWNLHRFCNFWFGLCTNILALTNLFTSKKMLCSFLLLFKHFFQNLLGNKTKCAQNWVEKEFFTFNAGYSIVCFFLQTKYIVTWGCSLSSL